MVRMVPVARGGRGGQVPQVHVDSLPPDLREAWHAARGIALHAPAEPGVAGTVAVRDGDAGGDPDWARQVALARWRHSVIAPALAEAPRSAERSRVVHALAATSRLHPNGQTKAVGHTTLYDWIAAFEAEGLIGLTRKKRKDIGGRLQLVSRAWDAFVLPHVARPDAEGVHEEIVAYIGGLWAAGEAGRRSIAEKSTTRLIEITRGLSLVAFDALPVGGLRDRGKDRTQFGICHVNGRMVDAHRGKRILAVQRRDNAVFQDRFMPSIRRHYDDLKPREIVVGDVHPVDIMMRRPDGSIVHPKAIAWYDIATNEMHKTFVLLAKGEGVRRSHVAQAFSAMVSSWGLPGMLYLDNGGEYSDPAMMAGFTELSRLTYGQMAVYNLADAPQVLERAEAVVRSRPYNAKGKPGIEGAFGNLEQRFFSIVPGWVAGDRMRKKTHAKGKDPVAFDGDEAAFLRVMDRILEWYHKTPQTAGRLQGLSPNEALRAHVEAGWGKTVPSSPDVLPLAFSDAVTRMPDRGRVSYARARERAVYYYHDDLLGWDRKVTVRVPAYGDHFALIFDGDRLICKAFPEPTFGVLDGAGAAEVGRRSKVLRRKLADERRSVARLSLLDETGRHLDHLPDAPEVPVAAVVDAGILDRLAKAEDAARAARDAAPAPRIPEQWKTGTVKALQDFKFADEED